MLAKPQRRGMFIGEIYTCRVGTDTRLVHVPSEDADGTVTFRHMKIETKIESSLVWNGSDWLTMAELERWRQSRKLEAKPKTIRRPARG